MKFFVIRYDENDNAQYTSQPFNSYTEAEDFLSGLADEDEYAIEYLQEEF